MNKLIFLIITHSYQILCKENTNLRQLVAEVWGYN